MVPLHESDVAENRWKEAEWSRYELWERIELKLRKRRHWIVAGTVALFLALSSVPIFRERLPKWRGASAVRALAIEMNRMKLEASMERKPMRVVFFPDLNQYRIERVEQCGAVMGHPVREGIVIRSGKFRVLTREQGEALGVPGLVTEVCYDPAIGNPTITEPTQIQAIGLIPVSDLTEERVDRLSLLYFSGSAAEISFD